MTRCNADEWTNGVSRRFVLGAILAPTDAEVLENLLRQIVLPSGLRGALVGESLFNDGAGVVLCLIALRVTR
jgi:CPA1 family monovalent cation:H+ antiporter